MTEELPHLPPRSWYEEHPEGVAKGIDAYHAAGLKVPYWLSDLAGIEREAKPVPDSVAPYLPEWEDLWEEVHHNEIDFFIEARNRGLIDDETFELEINKLMPPVVEVPEPHLATREELRALVGEAAFEANRGYFATAFYDVLKSLWSWFIEKLKDLVDLVVSVTRSAWKTVWNNVDGVTQTTSSLLFSGLQMPFEGHSPIKPEDAWTIASNLYTFALKSGVAAHATALGAEMVHPVKHVGLGSIPAMIGEFAGFSRVSSASLGVLMSRVLAQAMTYNVQYKYRPLQPDPFLLQIMAVKPDITNEQFRRGMAYQGYSEEWIDAIQTTMYHEPRYFELKMMSEDEAATDEWLRLKSRRAGFTEEDTDVMVRSYVKQAARTQRQDFYKNTFYMYKEGYVTREKFEQMLDELELRPEAKTFGARSAELAYLIDYIKDMISYYVDSFLKDVIDDDELLVSLVSLGLVPERAWLLTARTKLRKMPRPRYPVATAAKKVTTKVQTKYIQLYREQFRKGLIDRDRYLESLLSVGLTADLAEVSVQLEEAKMTPAAPAPG